MALLVRHGAGELTYQLLPLIQASYTQHHTCGVILAPCADIRPKVLDQLKAFMEKFEPDLSPHYFFDDQSMILGMVLDKRKLAGTHYTSLRLKEFLQDQGLLEGKMGVASFPESGEPSEDTLSEWLRTMTRDKDQNKEIQLYIDPSVKEGISSILVVDPDEVSRDFVKLRLTLKGYEVYEATDGYEALQKYSQESPDLVITELNLPVLDGYQLISNIKKNPANEGKVMVLTDKHLTQNMNRAFELGASDYVTKPFSISELEWRIKKLANY